jgi:hypothetical protein
MKVLSGMNMIMKKTTKLHRIYLVPESKGKGLEKQPFSFK